jgi:nitrite reductase (NADH) small subunit
VSGWVDVGPASALASEGRLLARVGGREIGVLRDADGSLWAVRNRCPHHGAPLALGSLGRRLAGAPGRYETSDQRSLRCPWHGWEFDPARGACLDDPALRVAVYPARIVDSRVLVRA